MLESKPPDKNVQSGTSDTNCLFILSSNKYLTFIQVSSKESTCGLLINFQYLWTNNPYLLNIAKLAGFNSYISLNTVVPAVWAGPIPKSSQIPFWSTTFSMPGNSNKAFISEAKIKLSFFIV